MVEREKGFLQAIADAELIVPDKAILKVLFSESEENIINDICKYLFVNPELDSLFFATNYLGVMGIEALQKCNINIPKDIAVVSFDDNDLFRLLTPSITVAAQPIKEMATKSIELLLRLIKKDPKLLKPQGEIIKSEIIIREILKYSEKHL